MLNALHRLRFTAMRYPGGNFASVYHWMDGIGPREKRPVIRDLAWQSLESNQIGTDEFVCLSRQMGWDPMMTVNLGTGTPEEARNWVEYCNCPAGIKLGMLALRNDEFGLGLFKSNAPPGQVNVIGLKMPTEEIAKVRARLPCNTQVLEDNPHYLEFRDPYQITWQIMLLERKFSTS